MLPAGEEQAGLVVPPLVQLPPEQYADLLTGSVKCWFEDRGFGFIRPEGGEEDVFVHKKVLKDGQSLIEGSSVMFNLTYDADRRRFQATRCFGATLPPEEAPAMPRKWKLPFCLADPWEELYRCGRARGSAQQPARAEGRGGERGAEEVDIDLRLL
ncbi:unnamed protein product [Effrenium voratum]|uniref:CSD domain-containing protein n=1 Tax=Effrenium voratum TaxID=2562239 RepID=A0AA36NKA5_9DINO|nr:unnamed protein product [Effrenium voratum]CAJ1410617.1 unnamed protein product [Effrenium voratum]CAJ1413097.1 unnamed protein product [Effrenium voratum]